MKEIVSFSDFLKLDIRVGTIIRADVFKEARKPAYILHIDFGDEVGVRKTSAQITDRYEPEGLVGKQVMAVVNFATKQIGPIQSEVLTLGASDDAGHIVLISPEYKVPNGSIMH